MDLSSMEKVFKDGLLSNEGLSQGSKLIISLPLFQERGVIRNIPVIALSKSLTITRVKDFLKAPKNFKKQMLKSEAGIFIVLPRDVFWKFLAEVLLGSSFPICSNYRSDGFHPVFPAAKSRDCQ